MQTYKSVYWRIAGVAFSLLLFLAACKKSNDTTPAATSVQLQILNFSPDAYPVAFFLNDVQQNRTAATGITSVKTYYSYASRTGTTSSDYFYLSSAQYPLQIRSTKTLNRVISTDDTTALNSYTKYTVYVVGLDADNTLTSVTTNDNAEPLPSIGKGGKVRYINLSPRTASSAYDIYANGIKVNEFTNVLFKKKSAYVTLPAGNYIFKAFATGNSTDALTTMSSFTIQDGHLYTLFAQGLSSRTDSAALSLGVITNQ
ncbi:DUF4397 domain-containing protein [Mucilaginibacter robiniae]|uniref:DUF4397 domain-containing protein n=1 Tax=Mucilaginibacter robiniae TaxID=2728022 RepID=A0A7L5DVK8_9SPHI|nr:DUF4397 domain-containing protein [Mucilaginibacter robiniae]QJD95112.1 DUF4397 domain-containing protein [Mucilaginibacter robiniae]